MLRMALWAVFFAVVLVGLSYLSRSDTLRIDTIAAVGNDVTPSAELEAIARRHLDESYAYAFSKNNIFLYPKKEIEADMLEQFKRIVSVDIDTTGVHTMTLHVTERVPYATWCSGNPEGSTDSSVSACYFLDRGGYIFAKAPEFSGSVYVKYYGAIGGDPLGVQFLTQSSFKNVDAFAQGLTSLHIESLYVLATGDGEYEAHLPQGGKIIWSERAPAKDTLMNLNALLNQNNLISSTSTLDYIDLRFGNKLYFKLK